jgi:ketosteroid isomerase-like protein
MSQGELETRIAVLEDIEAIKKLKYQYAHLVDTRNWRDFAKLATEDAIWDFGDLGLYKGREEIIHFTRDIILEAYSFMMHMFHNPIIEVKGDTATGEWYFEVPATDKAKNRAVWISGRYEEEYVKIKGEWKFKKVVGNIYFITPYDEGWVKTKMLQ